ncbi:hypothetical protein M409DRAFT_53162 [Zasmidium cellare ATCC 36951]|uniref:Uncharacterized protein n=1 Tax=Zasmidium cellare ATCC 36951 TaxID=1080233 RepID=A0A6A6CSQ2_ZASCE|nr:uncharacterized protein M409DRAFT_53162 [Zasmidium cellare ATCC 36951]KAF2168496.1 hypothetical protein M409DRAFT_53162 [Zasmidium cellare ATCC 36951]
MKMARSRPSASASEPGLAWTDPTTSGSSAMSGSCLRILASPNWRNGTLCWTGVDRRSLDSRRLSKEGLSWLNTRATTYCGSAKTCETRAGRSDGRRNASHPSPPLAGEVSVLDTALLGDLHLKIVDSCELAHQQRQKKEEERKEEKEEQSESPSKVKKVARKMAGAVRQALRRYLLSYVLIALGWMVQGHRHLASVRVRVDRLLHGGTLLIRIIDRGVVISDAETVGNHVEVGQKVVEETRRALGSVRFPRAGSIDTIHETDPLLLEWDHRIGLLERLDDLDVGRRSRGRDEGQVGRGAVVDGEAVVLVDTNINTLDERLVDWPTASSLDVGTTDVDVVVSHGSAMVSGGQGDGADSCVALDWSGVDGGQAEEGKQQQHREEDVEGGDGSKAKLRLILEEIS